MEDYKLVDILLVEDNEDDAELIVRALRKNTMVTKIFVISNGAEALDFFFCRGIYSDRSMDNPPRVVLLDLKLPKVNGLEIVKKLKEDPRTASIPIVVLTSSHEEPDIRTAYRLGVNSYIVKPLEFNQFIDALSHVGLYWMLLNKQ